MADGATSNLAERYDLATNVWEVATQMAAARMLTPWGEREILENQPEITTRTVIWARQLVPCQPSAEAGAGPVAERARVDESDTVGRPCEEARELAKTK